MVNSIYGHANLVAPGKLSVILSNTPFPVDANYIILGTDYSNFSVVYSCLDLVLAKGRKYQRNFLSIDTHSNFNHLIQF